MENIKVNNVIIGKQPENSENYQKFKETVKNKKINVIIVEVKDTDDTRNRIDAKTIGSGIDSSKNEISKINQYVYNNILYIEKNLYFQILWPDTKNVISGNALNNSSLVFKLNYINYSMLFMGDIEEVAEKQILKKYKNNLEILKADVLKIPHHGSNSSSTKEFIEAVKPKIALIGVGENNKFGHPNEQVIERLIDFGVQIYRTDKSGEISINVNKNGRFTVRKFI